MRRTLAYIICCCAGVVCIAVAGVARTGYAEEQDPVDYKKLENPVKFTKTSISRGRVFYNRMCVECHGPDGKAQIDIVANATNLTDPKRYHNGATVGEVYRSIKLGAGDGMPPFKAQLKKEEDIWHVVNFVQSLWPEDQRPKLEEEAGTETKSEAQQ